MEVWFEENSLKEMVGERRDHDAQNSPNDDDFMEASLWIERETKSQQLPIKVLFFVGAILEFLIYRYVNFQGALYFHIAFSILVYLTLVSISLILTVDIENNLLGGKKDEKRVNFKRLPKVFLSVVGVFITVPLFIIPNPWSSPSFLKVPYQIAKGATIRDAISLSVKDKKRSPSGDRLLFVSFFNALISIAFLVIVFELVGGWIPLGLSDLVFHLFKAGTLFGIWSYTFAIALVEEAYYSGAIPNDRLAQTRKPRSAFSSTWNYASKLGPLVVFLVFFVMTQTDFRKAESKVSSDRDMVWQMEDIEGNQVFSSKYQTKPLVIYAWAPWCMPCKIQTPNTKKLFDQRGEDYEVISVSMSYKDRQSVLDYAEDYDLPYSVFYGTNAFEELTQVKAFPTTLVVKNNRIVAQWTGVTSTRRIKAAVLSKE